MAIVDMNRRFAISLIAVFCISLMWGCVKSEYVEDDILTSDKTEYTIGAEGGTFFISYNTNLTCSVKSDASWLTVETNTRAITTQTVSLIAKANTSTEARKATVTVNGGTLSVPLTVNQKGVDPSIVINGSKSVSVTDEGGTVSVEVTSNVSYSTIINGNWIHAAGSSNGAESFSVEANESKEAREGSITFSYGSITQTVTVTQAGKKIVREEPYLMVSPTVIDAPAPGGQYDIIVSTNTQYTTTSTSDWVRVQGDKVIVDENSVTEPRSTKIQFSAEETSVEITVNQAAKEKPQPYINVDVAQFDLEAGSATITVNVTSNIEYQTTVSADWITPVGNGMFNVAANEYVDARSATVIFSGEGIKNTVTVNQKGKIETPAPTEENILLNGGESTYNVSADGETIEIVIRTNVEYTVDCSADWIKETSTRTVRDDRRLFVVEANTGEARLGTITVTYDQTLSFTVTVKQDKYNPQGDVIDDHQNEGSDNNTEQNDDNAAKMEGIKNVLLNAALITDCKYVTTNRLNAQKTYEKGSTITGLVYSSSRYEDLLCPNNVSYWTYITAMSDPNSYQYTKDISVPPYSISGLAKAYYGQVCSSFVQYALGIKYNFQIHQMTVWEDFDKVEPNNVNSLELGDMLTSEKKTHTRLVTGINKENEKIVSVVISEGVVPVAVKKELSAEEIQKTIENDGYQIFRYRNIANVKSPPFPYDYYYNETNTINPNIMPRRGDRANWRKDENVVIDILDSQLFSAYKVYKDGELYKETPLSKGDTEIDLGVLPPGDYSMVLNNKEYESPPVYWMVVDYNANVVPIGSGKIFASFSSYNAKPIFLTWRRPWSFNVSNNDMPLWTTVIDDDACEQGNIESELDTHFVKKYGLGYWDFTVAFETKYGIISSDNISIYVE